MAPALTLGAGIDRMRSLKSFLPFRLKGYIKESVAVVFNIPCSRFDVPTALMKAIPGIKRSR